jgi:hypothetical protein
VEYPKSEKLKNKVSSPGVEVVECFKIARRVVIPKTYENIEWVGSTKTCVEDPQVNETPCLGESTELPMKMKVVVQGEKMNDLMDVATYEEGEIVDM